MSEEISDLTVVTVAENDSGLINLMIDSLYKFTSPKPKIIICDNGRNGNILDQYKNDPNIVILNHTPTMSGGSNRHGESLNKVFKEITTTRAAIVESDCIITANDWDKYDVNKYDAMASLKGIYNSFPYYYAAFLGFKTDILKNLDCRPGKDNNRANRSYKSHEDVLWRVAEKIDPRRIMKVECVDCKTGEGQFLDSTFQCEEYWVNGGMVAVHFGRGSNIGGKANRKGFDTHKAQLARFREAVEQLLE